jgi:hypothetical protein
VLLDKTLGKMEMIERYAYLEKLNAGKISQFANKSNSKETGK